ncbi:MAG: hypothetical protein GXO16_09410 [Epsilonproteobacteria bacterium]|nr:hypothetical protein [Campylobacterota bacterium]
MVVRYFDFGQDTPLQYALERRSYLASVIVQYALWLKIGLLFYFVFALDKLSAIIPGAMCAAGVVTANEYGVPLLMMKVVGIYLFGLWLILNAHDFRTKDFHYTKMKFWLFLGIFLFALAEYGLELLFFRDLDVSKVVSCCGVLFNPLRSSAAAKLLALDPRVTALLFYGVAALMLLAAWRRWIYLFAFLSLLFLVVGVISLIEYFSPYIYELPTHRCPFCILQPEYGYVGYVLYGALLGGSFLGVKAGFEKWLVGIEPSLRWALVLDLLYVVMVSFYPILYIIRNGVRLF